MHAKRDMADVLLVRLPVLKLMSNSSKSARESRT
jgi:hypothetical protein